MSNQSNVNFHFTIDVDWTPGSEIGLRGLYDFCDQHDLNATLFVTGRFAQDYAELIKEAGERGYELGTHGWEHGVNPNESFRTGTYEEQKRWISDSTKAVEKASGIRPVAFRAPNLWVGETTLRVLEEENYQIDSSVPARRFDFGIGMVNYRGYFGAPLEPYHPARDNLAVRGDSSIIEIVPSAFLIPINMSALRVLGMKAVEWAVRRVSQRSRVLVFYLHPAEFVSPEYLSLVPDEPARYREGIGPENFALLGRFVERVKALGCSSGTFSMYQT